VPNNYPPEFRRQMVDCELIDRRTFRTRSEAERAIFAYIEGFYNPRRRHSANSQLSPAEYERRHLHEQPRRRLCCRVAESPDVSTEPGATPRYNRLSVTLRANAAALAIGVRRGIRNLMPLALTLDDFARLRSPGRVSLRAGTAL
jgi:Integrase core domain